MAAIRVVGRPRVRPAQFVRNGGSWQSQNLVAWVPLGAAGVAREMVRGNTVAIGALGGMLPPRADGQLGGGLVFDGSGTQSGGAATFPSYADYSLTTFTVTAVGLLTTVSASDTLWCRTVGTASNGMWMLGVDVGGANFRFVVHDGTQRNVLGTAPATQKVYYLCGVYDGPALAMSLYEQGRLVTTTGTIGGSPSAITQGLTLFGRGATGAGDGTNWVGAGWDMRYYSSAWSAGQVAEWAENPWDLYLASPRRLYFDQAISPSVPGVPVDLAQRGAVGAGILGARRQLQYLAIAGPVLVPIAALPWQGPALSDPLPRRLPVRDPGGALCASVPDPLSAGSLTGTIVAGTPTDVIVPSGLVGETGT